MHRTFPVIVVVLLCALGRGDAAQQVSGALPRILDGILTAANTITQRFDGTVAQKTQMLAITKDIGSNLVRLRSALDGRDVPSTFEQSLESDRRALEERAQGPQDPEHTMRVSTGVADDLGVKATYAESTKKKGQKIVDVKVTARTKDAKAQEQSGLQVWYVLRGFADNSKEYKPFPRFSSPTDHDIPPGAYILWSRTTDAKTAGAKTPYDVGKNGETAMPPLDLPAPRR